MAGIKCSLPVSGTRTVREGGKSTISGFLKYALLAFVILQPTNGMAYDAPWDGGHITTSPGGGSGGGPPGGGGQGGGGDPVNLKAGNFGWGYVDVAIPGRGHPLYILRAYNSQDRYVGPFGYGWHFMPMRQCIEVVAGSATEVVVKRGDGVRKIFIENADSTYRAKDGSNRHTLSKDQTGFHLTDYDSVTYNFGLDGILQNVEDNNGNTLTYGYDGLGRLITLTDSSSRQLTMSYNGDNRITAITDFAGRTVSYGYDDKNNLISFTNQLGKKTTYTYDENHLLLSVTDAEGTALIANNYDTRNRVVSQSFLGENVSFTYNTTYTRVNNRTGHNFDIYLNDDGNPTRIIDPALTNYYMTFTEDGQPVTLSDGQGQIQFAYDSLGRVRSYIAEDGATTLYSYHDDTKLVASITDPRGRVTTFSYAANGNLTQKRNQVGEVTQYQYFANGKLRKITYSDGTVTDLTYSSAGYLRVLKDTIGTDVYSASFSYDAVGNIISIALADGNTVSSEYNNLNQLTRVTDRRFSPARVTEYEYDAGGNMTVVRQDGNTKQLQYINNQISMITYPDASQTIYLFNGNDQISQVTYGLGSMVYTHNNVERVTKATHPDTSEFDFGWVNDNLTTLTGPGTDLTLTYDNRRRVTGITDNSTGKTTYFSYAGNVRTQMTHTGGYYRDYSYDQAERLLGYNDSDGTTQTFAIPLSRKQPATLNDIATAAMYSKNNWLIQLLEARGPGGAASRNEVRYPGTEFWHNSYSVNKRWYMSLMPGLSSNRLNQNVRTPMDIMR